MRLNAIYKLGAVICVLCALAVALTGCGGGGGGGGNPGGGGGNATATGFVFSVESASPLSGATVKIGNQTTTTDATGKFTLSNLATNPSATFSATDEVTLTQPLTLQAGTVNDLGNIYLSNVGYTANVTGRVVTTTTVGITPVTNATVTINGLTTKSAADGTFTLTKLPVGLGANNGTVGSIVAAGFEVKPITADTLQFALVAGANPLGDILISQPSGSTPIAPYTIKGVVTVGGTPAAGVAVALSTGGTSLGSTTTDSTGTYYFWVVPGAYTLTAANATSTQTTNATLARADTPITVPTIALP